MISSQLKTAATLGLALFVLAALNGCQGSGRTSESEKAVGSMEDTLEQIEKLRQQVTKTNSALDQLSGGGDLQKSFKTYSSEVSDLQNTGEKAKSHWNDMKVRGNEYIAKWQSEMEQVSNPEIKQSLAARRDKVRADYERVSAASKEVREAWDPYMADVQEIKRALSVDLSPGGVQALQSPMSKAKSQGVKLSQKLDTLHNEMTTLMSNVSPKTAK